MLVVGRLIFKELVLLRSQDVEFYRIVVVVEMGHRAEHKRLSVFDSKAMQILSSMDIDAFVKVNTYFSNSGYQTVSNIVKIDELQSCHLCFNLTELTDAQLSFCDGCSRQVRQERVDGLWKVITIRDYLSSTQQHQLCDTEVAKRIIFQQDNKLLGFISFPKTPYFDCLSVLHLSDEINLTGWRDSERRFTLVSLSPKCTLQNVIQEELTL